MNIDTIVCELEEKRTIKTQKKDKQFYRQLKNKFNYMKFSFEKPMTAHAIRLPAFPVVRLFGEDPSPQSSGSACIISPRPIMLALFPRSLITLS